MHHSGRMLEGRDVGSYRARIIEWYVNVLCRFEREERVPVSELMSAGQMSRGFSTELSYPRAQQNVQSHHPMFADVCMRPCVQAYERSCLRTSCINRTLSRGTVSSGPPPLARDCKRRRAESKNVCVWWRLKNLVRRGRLVTFTWFAPDLSSIDRSSIRPNRNL